MNRQSLLEYRAHLEKQRKAAAAKWQEQIDAVDVLLRNMPDDAKPERKTTESHEPANSQTHPPTPTSDTGTDKASIIDLVREAVAHTQGNFSVKEILKIIRRTHPEVKLKPTDLSNPLWRLAKKTGKSRWLKKGKEGGPAFM